MTRTLHTRRLAVLAALTAAMLPAAIPTAGHATSRDYEVWLTDQNNTAGFSDTAPRGTHGGRVLIYDGDDLERRGGPVDEPEVLELPSLYALGGPNNATGANVVRPHMIAPSPDHRYMGLAFVASGHVAIIEASTRRPVALFRMSPGAGGARQAHAAFWTRDGRALIVANQNGKLLERIDHDPATGSFTHTTAATLDLANCVTPNGHPCQTATPVNDSDPAYLGPDNRPDNAPICPVISSDDKAYTTLRGGGMLVVDTTRTPMAIVGEYGTSSVGRDGCGGRQRGEAVYLNSGSGTPVTNPSQFSLYEILNTFPGAPAFLAPNTPPATEFFTAPGSDGHDAHGMVMTRNDRFLWQFDRLANEAQVFDPKKSPPTHVGTVDLATPGLSTDPTPDIVERSPDGKRIYVALRGPLPQTGAHASAGNTPGLGIVTLRGNGRTGALTDVLRTSSINPAGQQESDPHGLTIRLKAGPGRSQVATTRAARRGALICDLTRARR
jgi:hypothetical protein